MAGKPSKDLALVLPPRTLAHRRAKGQFLSPDESDRALRVARLVALAEGVFGDREKALCWLRKPQARFSVYDHLPIANFHGWVNNDRQILNLSFFPGD
ncbi:MAG: hypothetical protein PHE55_19650 [Methylococcaceae bacterium]|nr:hypothetical protein [Methylococcaceae bacterium]